MGHIISRNTNIKCYAFVKKSKYQLSNQLTNKQEYVEKYHILMLCTYITRQWTELYTTIYKTMNDIQNNEL